MGLYGSGPAPTEGEFRALIRSEVGGGWGFYADARTTQAGAQSIATHATDFTSIVNLADGFIVEELPDDAPASFWDGASSIVPYNLHDVLHVRVRMIVENYSGSAPFLELVIEAGGASGVIEARSVPLLKGGIPQIVEMTGALFVGSDFLANGGELMMRYDGNGSIDVYGVSSFIQRTYCKDN